MCRQCEKSSPFNSTHYIVLYPQNGDRIVTIYSVTSLHPVYSFGGVAIRYVGLLPCYGRRTSHPHLHTIKNQRVGDNRIPHVITFRPSSPSGGTSRRLHRATLLIPGTKCAIYNCLALSYECSVILNYTVSQKKQDT